ncbi:MAG: MFS transporter, partial [Ruminococcaceae bacterium]|nr:MFS transporter [Oscillospiraceae bacterium]
MKTKLSGRFWLALTIFSLMGQIAWVVENMYFNVFIYKMFAASATDISAMVAASAVAATLTTVFMGSLSDRIGKRKLFICAGYILWGVSIFGFVLLRADILEGIIPATLSVATVGVSLTILLDCLMTFFGSTANDAAFNAWLTDSTDHTNRGAAEGINAMMPLLAILVVFGGFMFFDLSVADSWTVIFTVIGSLTLLIGVLGIFLIQEPPMTPAKEGYFQSILYGFRPRTVRENRVLYAALAGFILFNISIQIFMPYLIIYYEVSLGMTDYVFIMAPAILVAAAVTAFWGKLYDKKGFSFSGTIAVLGLIAGYLLLFFFRDTAMVFIGSLLMMSGYLAGMAVFGATIRDHTPAGKAGMLQGVRIFSQVLIPGIIGPYIGGLVLADAETILNNDGTTSFVPNANIFLAALVAVIPALIAIPLIKKLKKPRLVELTTPFEGEMGEIPFAEYPRPQMKRDSYLCLNGKWSLSVRSPKGEEQLGQILLPYPPESRLSGIGRITGKKETLLYSRKISLPEELRKGRLLLHFGAADQYAEVFVNGVSVGTHEGGYLPFTFDVTNQVVSGENTLTVAVSDPLDIELPYGKQTYRRGGMWYTPVSGIWQTVWMESVPEEYIRSLRITPTCSAVTVEVSGGAEEKTLTIGEKVYHFTGDAVTVAVENPHLWTPDDPHCYSFTLQSGEDMVSSYFALRTVSIEEREGRSL